MTGDCERRVRRDEGFTLVETVIALVLLGMVLAATGALVVRSLGWTGEAHRTITATLVANQAIEQARTVPATLDASGRSALTGGRTPSAVQAVPLDDVDLSDTDLAYTTDPSSPLAVPLSTTREVDGTPYTVRTVVGTCVRQVAGGACVRGPAPAGAVELFRVVAAVTWPGCSRECPVTVTTLVDPARDPAYNALRDVLPVALDKCFSTPSGTALIFDATYKDFATKDAGDLGNAPVTDVAGPARGVLRTNEGSSTLTYEPDPDDNVYTTSFSYRVVDRYNRQSPPATITLKVGGSPC